VVPSFLLCIFCGSQMAVSYFLVGLASIALAVAQSIGDATLTTTITSDGSTIISTYVGTAVDSTQSLAQTTITTYTTEIPTSLASTLLSPSVTLATITTALTSDGTTFLTTLTTEVPTGPITSALGSVFSNLPELAVSLQAETNSDGSAISVLVFAGAGWPSRTTVTPSTALPTDSPEATSREQAIQAQFSALQQSISVFLANPADDKIQGLKDTTDGVIASALGLLASVGGGGGGGGGGGNILGGLFGAIGKGNSAAGQRFVRHCR